MPHVLIILDCCYAANAARDTAEGTTKELLAACGRENPTPGVCERSFTSALVEEMQAFGNRPFTVAMLHSRLITMRWRLTFTPVYALLSEHGGNSITMSPLEKGKSILAPGSSPLASIPELDGKAITDLDGSSSAVSQAVDTRVLLSVSVTQAAELELPQWKTWLTTAVPWSITKVDVHLHSIFRGHSTLVIVSIPISTWDLLPGRPAYRFIGFIRSGNLLGQSEITDVITQYKSKWPDPVHMNDTTAQSRVTRVLPPLFSVATSSMTDKDCSKSKRVSVPYTMPLLASDCNPSGSSSSSSWSLLDDERLLRARAQGLTFQLMATQLFPDKTANACRKRHERLMEKRNSADTWDSIKMDAIAKAYVELREKMWQLLASRIGEKWQTGEAKACIYPNIDDKFSKG